MNTEPTMTCLDPETLAAFIDRRLPEEERRRVTEHLAECPDCHEVLVETVRFLEEEPGGVDVAPDVDRTVRRGPWGLGGRALRLALPFAAAMIVALGLWMVIGPGGGAPNAGELPTAVALAATLDPSGLAPGVFEGQGWPVTRGEGEPAASIEVGATVAPEAAFRLGALTVALEAAQAAGATEAAIGLTYDVEGLLEEEVDLAEPLVQIYRDLRGRLQASGSAETATLAAEAASYVEERVGVERFRLGAWAEAGRLAVAAGNVEYLDARPFGRAAERLAERNLEPELAAEVDAVAAVLRAGVDDSDLPTLEQRFSDLVRLGGGRI